MGQDGFIFFFFFNFLFNSWTVGSGRLVGIGEWGSVEVPWSRFEVGWEERVRVVMDEVGIPLLLFITEHTQR